MKWALRSLALLSVLMAFVFLCLLGYRLIAPSDLPNRNADIEPTRQSRLNNGSGSHHDEQKPVPSAPTGDRIAQLIESVRAPETKSEDRIAAVLEISHSGTPGSDRILLDLFGCMKTTLERRILVGGLYIAGDLNSALSAIDNCTLPQVTKDELAELLTSVHKFGIHLPPNRGDDQ